MACIVSKLLQVMYCKYCKVYCKLSDYKYKKKKKKKNSQDQELIGHLPIALSFLLRKFLSREGCM